MCQNTIKGKSHFEYLVRNPVHLAYQQGLVVQGVQCVLYMVCNVYCTRCAVCIVLGVQCVLYKVCSVYCTLSPPAKSIVDKEEFDIKSNIIKYNPVLNV